MGASIDQTAIAGDWYNDHGWQDLHSIDIEKKVIAAGSHLKRVVCSRLLGEISDQQYDLERSGLLEQIRLLMSRAGDVHRRYMSDPASRN